MSADDHPSRRRPRRPPGSVPSMAVGDLLCVTDDEGRQFHAIVCAVREFGDGRVEMDCVTDRDIDGGQ